MLTKINAYEIAYISGCGRMYLGHLDPNAWSICENICDPINIHAKYNACVRDCIDVYREGDSEGIWEGVKIGATIGVGVTTLLTVGILYAHKTMGVSP